MQRGADLPVQGTRAEGEAPFPPQRGDRGLHPVQRLGQRRFLLRQRGALGQRVRDHGEARRRQVPQADDAVRIHPVLFGAGLDAGVLLHRGGQGVRHPRPQHVEDGFFLCQCRADEDDGTPAEGEGREVPRCRERDRVRGGRHIPRQAAMFQAFPQQDGTGAQRGHGRAAHAGAAIGKAVMADSIQYGMTACAARRGLSTPLRWRDVV